MPRIELGRAFVDGAHEPSGAAVAAKQAALGVGPDTAAVLTRRDTLTAQAAVYRARAGADLDVADMLDTLIAAVFDA